MTVESVDAIEDLLAMAEEGPFAVQANDSERFLVRCNCTEGHPGRPPRITRGCGQWAHIARRQKMDKSALLALLIGGGALALTLLAIIWRTGRVESDPEPPGWGQTDAAQEWDEKAAAAREEFGLPVIRATAKTWGASIAGLLGILSTVAFVAGPDNLVKDVGGTEADVAAWLILAAAAIAAIAVTLAILAEQAFHAMSRTSTVGGSGA